MPYEDFVDPFVRVINVLAFKSIFCNGLLTVSNASPSLCSETEQRQCVNCVWCIIVERLLCFHLSPL